MHRLNRRLQLIAARPPAGAGSRELALRLDDHRARPERRVLLGQRHESAGGAAAGGTARFTVEHQRQQPACFGLARQQCGDQPCQPDRLLRQALAPHVGAGRVLPAAAISGVDRVQHRLEPPWQLAGLGDGKRDPGIADLGLGADQPLAHGRRRDQKGRGDPGGVEPQHGLQHQRRPRRRVDRGMGADEQELEPLVGEGSAARAVPRPTAPASAPPRAGLSRACRPGSVGAEPR